MPSSRGLRASAAAGTPLVAINPLGGVGTAGISGAGSINKPADAFSKVLKGQAHGPSQPQRIENSPIPAQQQTQARELEKAVETLFAAHQPQLAAQVLERIIVRLRRQGRVAGLPRLLKAQLMMVERAAGALNDPRREAAHFEAGVLVAELLADHRAQALFWLGPGRWQPSLCTCLVR